MNECSQYKPQELKVIVLDNGAFHKAKKLIIPDNIILIFLPPYSPELNTAEKIWWAIKRNFSNQLFKNLNELDDFIKSETLKLNNILVKNICEFNYVKESPFRSNI